MTRSSRWPGGKINLDTLAAILVTLAPLAYFNAALRGAVSLASDDGILFNVPLRVAAANIVREGSLPLWNPYIFSGMPLHAAAQGGLLFPLNWFFLLFEAPVAATLMALSTYMVAALGAYLFARRSGTSVSGAIVTSFVWQWCGFLIGQYSHVNIVQTAALLPWLLWAVDGYGARGDRKWGLAIAAIVMLQAFTGHQQTLVYSLLLAAAYALVMWRATRPAISAYLSSIVLLAAGMLLAAVQILPTYELMRNSVRSRASFDFFTAFSLPPKFLVTFFAPYLMGGGDGRLFRVNYFGAPFYGEFIGYVGLGALMLAVFAIVLKGDTRTKFWAVVAVVVFILALGRYWPLKLYGVVYYVPIINLFRVPARHLMEVDLALAVLAGRGLTALAAAGDRKRVLRISLMVGVIIFLITLLIVTVGRPAGFRLAREAPVTLLRAPELFLPLAFAALSAAALIWYVRSRAVVALAVFVSVVALDLCVWGQSSGWRVASPAYDSPVWSEPPLLGLLAQQTSGAEPYRILTAELPFDPNHEIEDPLTAPSRDFVFWLQPNIYMMHGVDNAAGYDGFGLARYGRLAGDMAVWGQLPKPDQTLRGPGRDLDLLNVRYLLAMDAPPDTDPMSEVLTGNQPAMLAPATVASATVASSFDSQHLPGDNLTVPSIDKDFSLIFDMPPFEATSITLLTNLAWSLDLPDGTPVARVRLKTQDGRVFDFDLLTGEHTSEWSYDRPDIRREIKHRRAKIGTSYRVQDARARYQGHTYVAVFNLPERAGIGGGEISVLPSETAPDLSLTVHRLSFAREDTTFPLRTEWVSRKRTSGVGGTSSERWRRVGEVKGVAVFENTRAMPRAWLASSFEVLKDNQILEVIRTGSLPNGDRWDPRRTALLEAPISFNPETPEDASATASVTHRSPNGVKVQTTSAGPSILVLSENYYPGWQVRVDGKSTEIMRVNYNLRGVVLGEGAHSVEFVYRPWSVLIGLVISALTLASLILWQAGWLDRLAQALHWERIIRRLARTRS